MNRIDTSNIDRMDIRQRIANREATRAGIVAEVEKAEAPFRERIAAIEAEMAEATKHLQERLDQHDDTAGDDQTHVYSYDEDGRPALCCLSGLVLLEGDHLIEDLYADNFALADVIPGWPARPQQLPDAEDEEQDEYDAGSPRRAA